MIQSGLKYDLEERTAQLGESIISLCRQVSKDSVSRPIVSQLVRSATSVGANYMEANGASSKKDFRNKIYICKKETQEIKHWLRMLSHAEPSLAETAKTAQKECQELILIFQKISSTLSKEN